MVAFLAIWVIYEVASAVITSVRSVQVLKHGGQRKSLTFLVLREGARHYLNLSPEFSPCSYSYVQFLRGRSNIFWVGFKQAPLWDALLIFRS